MLHTALLVFVFNVKFLGFYGIIDKKCEWSFTVVLKDFMVIIPNKSIEIFFILKNFIMIIQIQIHLLQIWVIIQLG